MSGDEAGFEAIRKQFGSRGHAKGCGVCGKKNQGGVAVTLQALGPTGSLRNGRVGSRMRSFCEQHASELFRELVAVLEERAGVEK